MHTTFMTEFYKYILVNVSLKHLQILKQSDISGISKTMHNCV